MRTKWCDNILHFYLLTVSGYVRKEVPRSPPWLVGSGNNTLPVLFPPRNLPGSRSSECWPLVASPGQTTSQRPGELESWRAGELHCRRAGPALCQGFLQAEGWITSSPSKYSTPSTPSPTPLPPTLLEEEVMTRRWELHYWLERMVEQPCSPACSTCCKFYHCLHCSVFTRGRWHLQHTTDWLPAPCCLLPVS